MWNVIRLASAVEGEARFYFCYGEVHLTGEGVLEAIPGSWTWAMFTASECGSEGPVSLTLLTATDDALPDVASITAYLRAPVLRLPVDGDEDVDLQPTLRWKQVPENSGYRIILSSDPDDLPTNPDEPGGTPDDGFNETVGSNVNYY